VRVTEGLELALFKLILTSPGGAGYGGSRSGTLLAALDFARWCGLRRVWSRLYSSIFFSLLGGAGYGGSGSL
jgi:hypothetical protein